MDYARNKALQIIYEITEKGAFSHIELDSSLNDPKLRDVDKGFVTELVYGTVRWLKKLDYIIDSFSTVKRKKITPWNINILRLGIYQILYMRVPDSAACNESVKLARKHGHAATGGFVNAVLRNIIRNKEQIIWPDREKDIISHLSVMHSYPEWLVEEWVNEYGADWTEELLKAGNLEPETTIRINRLKKQRDELTDELISEGAEVSEGRYHKDAILIKRPGSVTRFIGFRKGSFQVQDESSMFAATILCPKEGESVLDVCSAPGGKTTHIAEIMNNRGKISARDVYNGKLDMVKEAARRLGIKIIETKDWDARVPEPELFGTFDKVLVDAPCTGLGIIRKKPDIKWSRKKEDFNELSNLQEQILTVSSKYVKKGGMLVYSTCTLGKKENIDVIKRFCEKNLQFKMEDINEYLPDSLKRDSAKEGYIQLYPHIENTDGFFIAKMRRME